MLPDLCELNDFTFLTRWGMFMLSLERRNMLQLLCRASLEDSMQASRFIHVSVVSYVQYFSKFQYIFMRDLKSFCIREAAF